MTQRSQNFVSLNDHLCFSIYTTSRAIQRMYRPLLDDLNLTYPQYLTLVALWENGPQTVSQLGNKLDLDSGTLTPMLKRMEKANLIVRHRDVMDERVVLVELTEKGRRMQADSAIIPQTLLEKSGLDSDEWHTLNKTMKKLMVHVSE
ncbi:MarR family transcriptional regulator [Leuconostoc pseudomesenteroides]|uniref:MarR family winged helix-turn-helix transcriptional regulator n=3 Tax=Leuconostoc pseudomesenteroides TaxID=33968 RepID=UPI001E57915A|nr:MarR family transcriptional regulator [Leuconostoc pseudomesenteroides]MCC8439748.1 MarR family transcriptional regulator [Leuconostoc pseudomesenteroides]